MKNLQKIMKGKKFLALLLVVFFGMLASSNIEAKEGVHSMDTAEYMRDICFEFDKYLDKDESANPASPYMCAERWIVFITQSKTIKSMQDHYNKSEVTKIKNFPVFEKMLCQEFLDFSVSDFTEALDTFIKKYTEFKSWHWIDAATLIGSQTCDYEAWNGDV
tara:strand:- start:651 stop:1136 length:486 start_codon:yes stop_codon:yes gene_type:complete